VIDEDFIVSFITLIEYLGYKDIAESSEEFISLTDILETERLIIQNCIDLRKNHKIKLPDALIAATALSHNLTLITNNEKDFAQIQSLTVINLPYFV
jgi:predicted nucleic acid-binding protein